LALCPAVFVHIECGSKEEREREFDAQTIQLLRNRTVEFEGAVNQLCDALTREALSMTEQIKLGIGVGPGDVIGGFIVTAQGHSGVQLDQAAARFGMVLRNGWERAVGTGDRCKRDACIARSN
jgi:hypothetical protein